MRTDPSGELSAREVPDVDESRLSEIAAWLREAERVVVLTGAGVSAESGIPTFRDALEGLWARYDPQQLATPEAFEREPTLVARWYDERRLKVLECEPSPGHRALADMEHRLRERDRTFTLLTQNVDRLHQRAGSVEVVELHGTLCAWRCTRTGEVIEPGPDPFIEHPPRSSAGAPMRPNVVWFGEMLPEHALETAFGALDTADLFLSIGTSAVVHPAAGFADMARSRGARTVEINRDPTPITDLVDCSLLGRSAEVLPRLVETAFGD